MLTTTPPGRAVSEVKQSTITTLPHDEPCEDGLIFGMHEREGEMIPQVPILGSSNGGLVY